MDLSNECREATDEMCIAFVAWTWSTIIIVLFIFI